MIRSSRWTRASLALALLCPLVVAGGVAPARAADGVVVDDFENGLPQGQAGGVTVGFSTFQDPNSTIALTTAQPATPVPGSADGNEVASMDVDVVSYAGFAHLFEGPAGDTWVSQDWSAHEGVSFWLQGRGSGTTLFFDVIDNRTDPASGRDDAERWSTSLVDDVAGWRHVRLPFAQLTRKEIGNGAPNDGFDLTEVHGWAIGTITTESPQTFQVDDVALYGVAPERPLTVSFDRISTTVAEGDAASIAVELSKPSDVPVTVDYATTIGDAVAGEDFEPASGTLTFEPGTTSQSLTVATVDDDHHLGDVAVQVELSDVSAPAALGLPPVTRLLITDDEPYDPNLVDGFETQPFLWDAAGKATLDRAVIAEGDALARPGQVGAEGVLAVTPHQRSATSFGRSFAEGQDWSASSGLQLWYHGTGSGKEVQVSLGNTTYADQDPDRWKLAWSDEFDGVAGTQPSPDTWLPEIGDGTVKGIPGWGNDELQYYTDDPANVAMDGEGNLALTVRPGDGSRLCYYGPCSYTSARLITQDRVEVAYGRVETRALVPSGAGLWPAFWMLGTDIDRVGWPQTGEIDVMEHVGRLPEEIFGTLHGPGYSGGQSYGRYVDLGEPVAGTFHTYAVDWEPGRITWLLDGEPFFTATPGDAFLQGKEWVFDHPFFMLLNVAVGGNFGGTVDPDLELPATTLVDYVRVYQPKATTQTHTATFVDSTAGWRLVTIPFADFGPELDLTGVTSLSVKVPGGSPAPILVDEVGLACAAQATVTTAADTGAGSLRAAIAAVCPGGTVAMDPSLAGQTIALASGPLTVEKEVTVDASAAPGLVLSGQDADRVLVVERGGDLTLRHAQVADGRAAELGGGVLNNGALTLDHVVVRDNVMTTSAGDFWKGGGGIYSGEGSTLTLVDSTVAGNTAGWSGGGVYAFQGSTVEVTRSTISGNSSADVGGGIRSLGDVAITNSTLSGNVSTGWHGGAVFHTDATMRIESSTLTGNRGPDWAPSTIFVGSFGGPVPTLTLSNTIVAGNQWYACESAAGGSANVVSDGHNLVQDASCAPASTDLVGVEPLLGPLADNGGPTWTHDLLDGSPALDAAGVGPAEDQRGLPRPAGASADIGSVERQG